LRQVSVHDQLPVHQHCLDERRGGRSGRRGRHGRGRRGGRSGRRGGRDGGAGSAQRGAGGVVRAHVAHAEDISAEPCVVIEAPVPPTTHPSAAAWYTENAWAEDVELTWRQVSNSSSGPSPWVCFRSVSCDGGPCAPSNTPVSRGVVHRKRMGGGRRTHREFKGISAISVGMVPLSEFL
jgi:hypothetical protein